LRLAEQELSKVDINPKILIKLFSCFKKNSSTLITMEVVIQVELLPIPMRDGKNSSVNEDDATVPIDTPNQTLLIQNQLENKVKETDDNPLHKKEGSESLIKEEASFNDIENDLSQNTEQIEEENAQIPIANEDEEAKPKKKRKPSANNLAEIFKRS
jgi:hypothetical protein